MKYLPPESPLRRLIEINALNAETCEQIIREVEQYVVDRYETIEPRLRLSVTVTIPAEHSISGAAFSFAVHYGYLANESFCYIPLYKVAIPSSNLEAWTYDETNPRNGKPFSRGTQRSRQRD